MESLSDYESPFALSQGKRITIHKSRLTGYSRPFQETFPRA